MPLPLRRRELADADVLQHLAALTSNRGGFVLCQAAMLLPRPACACAPSSSANASSCSHAPRGRPYKARDSLSNVQRCAPLQLPRCLHSSSCAASSTRPYPPLPPIHLANAASGACTIARALHDGRDLHVFGSALKHARQVCSLSCALAHVLRSCGPRLIVRHQILFHGQDL